MELPNAKEIYVNLLMQKKDFHEEDAGHVEYLHGQSFESDPNIKKQ